MGRLYDKAQRLAEALVDGAPYGGAAQIEALIDQALRLSEPLERSETQALPETGGVIRIWADGACEGNPGPGGWGTIVEINGVRQELSGGKAKTTNNVMEMTGALEGLKACPRGAKVELTSDSQYVVKGMTEWIRGWIKKGWRKADGQPVANRELWEALLEEVESRQVKWLWVKGHAGHPENERCDE